MSFRSKQVVLTLAVAMHGLLSNAPTFVVGQDSTVRGPEASTLKSQVKGCLVFTRKRTELVALSLPDGKETTVRRTASGDADFYPTIHSISGPDSKGRLVYIEDHFFVADPKAKKHLLKQIQIDGTGDTAIFSRPGSAMWATTAAGKGEIGAHLALSPTAGKIAFVSGLKSRQMPGILFYEGNIEIWDSDNKGRLDVAAGAINQPLSWFPDGKRLAYVKLVPRDDLEKDAAGIKTFGKYFGESMAEVPAVYVLNITNGMSTFVHVGWTPVVSSDGTAVFVGGWDDRSCFSWIRFDLDGRTSASTHWEGDAGGPIAIPAKTLVLYKGLPTAGQSNKDQAVAPERSMITLKVATVNSGDFQTILREFDPRDLVSYGRVLP